MGKGSTYHQGDSQHRMETGNEYRILVTSDQQIKQRQERHRGMEGKGQLSGKEKN